MKKFLTVLILMTALISACDSKEHAAKELKKISITSYDGKKYDFNVELAVTPEQQARGLMNRTELEKKSGMLFIFPQEQEISFYMKNTLIPLDMIFIKRNGVIHRVHKNAIPNDLTSIPSNGPTYAVLEVIGGLTSELDIREGGIVTGSVFSNH
jgi:uncharacterized protein